MTSGRSIFQLSGVLQGYSWGGARFIPELLGITNEQGKPVAEYWMGAHAAAPSLVQTNSHQDTLDHLIQTDPLSILGQRVYNAFGSLPYLFKVLDVNDMLSIQVHPTLTAARQCFEEENKKGIPLNAPERNYKDDNHKPELMMALGPFWLLHGFREQPALQDLLIRVPELRHLIPVWESSGYQGLYEKVMLQPQELVNKQLAPLVNRIVPLYKEGKLKRDNPDFWAARAYLTFCTPEKIDRGLYSVYFLNLVQLQKGEAIFQDAGILHAYLEGQNLELMANSDNVLRGGLTQKHIDTTELLRHVKYEPTKPTVIKAVSNGPTGEARFITPAPDFELQQIQLSKGEIRTLQSATAEIFLVMEGVVEVKDHFSELKLHKGGTFLAIAEANFELHATQPCLIYKATVP
jgi:mannose-6-phosphate isomerase